MKTNALGSGISFWLCPSHAARKDIQSVIDDTSKRGGTPSFLPHVTIATADMTSAKAQAVLANFERCRPVLGHMAEPFRGDGSQVSLTMGYHYSVDAQGQDAYEAVKRRFLAAGVNAVVPPDNLHLSLIYQSGGVTDQQFKDISKQATMRDLPGRHVDLSELVAVAITKPFAHERQIGDWHVVASIELEATNNDAAA